MLIYGVWEIISGLLLRYGDHCSLSLPKTLGKVWKHHSRGRFPRTQLHKSSHRIMNQQLTACVKRFDKMYLAIGGGKKNPGNQLIFISRAACSQRCKIRTGNIHVDINNDGTKDSTIFWSTKKS